MNEIGLAMLKQSYMYGNEKSAEDVFKRIASVIEKENKEIGQRIYTYLCNEWFMFATPILSNLGTDRGQPISCFVNEVEDSKLGIFSVLNENNWLGSDGGGIGTDWSFVREIGAEIKNRGVSSGIIPFIKISDAATLAVSQGGVRRAAQAVFLDVSHPEIEEFLELRKEEAADNNRRCSNIHHGVKLSDKFMEAVEKGKEWELISPKTQQVVKVVKAREMFYKILTLRIERGEPFIFFTDNVNSSLPEEYVQQGKKVNVTNLCTEILQHTAPDKTAVCALASINLAKFDEWIKDDNFIFDVVFAMNVVLSEYIHSPNVLSSVKKSILEERNIGIGVMGWHSLLQSKGYPFESIPARTLNDRIFKYLSETIKNASIKLNPNSDTKPLNVLRMAIAPTSSISLICGGVSAGIEPFLSNVFTHKIQQGTFVVKNPYLDKLLKKLGREDAWESIIENGGSVQHLDFLSSWEKDTFKTAFEIDQRWIIDLAALRQPYICQGQSINLFLPAEISKLSLFSIHHYAWKRGIKTLYYVRSTPTRRVGLSKKQEREHIYLPADECLSCQ